MINLSFDELRLIAQIRNINDYENKSKEDFIKTLIEPETPKPKPETPKPETPKPKTPKPRTKARKKPKPELETKIRLKTDKGEIKKT